MAENNLKKLSRAELLEMLIDQTKENEALIEKNSALEQQVADLSQQLENRKIILENAGSIAEASLLLNQVFETAQAAADEYLNNLKEKFGEKTPSADISEEQMQSKVDLMYQQMQEKCSQMELETIAKCEAMTEKAKKDSQVYWDSVSSRLNQLMKQRAQMQTTAQETK